MFEKLLAITHGFNRRFEAGRDPFQIMTRLLEESGELAKEINHFEGTGIKRQKYGQPDRAHLVKEVRDVLVCALQVVDYYGVEAELRAHIDQTYQRMQAEGWIEPLS